MNHLRFKIFIIFGLIVTVTCCGAYYYILQEWQVYADNALKKMQVVSSSTQLLNDLKDAEIGQRGYLLTENPIYLEPFEKGITLIPSDIKKVDSLIQDNPDLRGFFKTKLERQITLKINELNKTIALQKTNRREEALAMVNEHIGKYTMDLIRNHIASIISTEKKALESSRLSAVRLRLIANYVLYISFAIISFLFIVSYLMISKKTDENHGLVEQLKILNAELEAKVVERTSELEKVNSLLLTYNQEIKDNNEKLKILNEDKNKFLSIASHDLKNPLNAIIGLIELLRDTKENLSGEQKEYLGFIGEASSKMTTLINYLLDISRIELGENVSKIERIDYHYEVENIIYNYMPLAKKKGIKILFSGQNMKGVSINNDRYRLVQVLDNLLSNAIKYSKMNSIIEVNLFHESTFARLTVKNQGEGIKENEMDFLFQKFKKLSTRPTGGENSSGLGLSIAKQFIDEMNGNIWCQSNPGQDVTFFVDLPI